MRTRAQLAFILTLLFASCRLYAPEVRDCAFRCGPRDACPVDTVCSEGFCRVKGATTRCDCRPGDTRACGGGKGLCVAGTQTCDADGAWSVCAGNVTPVAETCDNKDNDCDGVIDNQVTSAPQCALTAGVCALGSKRCVAGRFEACVDADYGLHYERSETSCDGLDNDCDGLVDATAVVQLAQNVTGDWDLAALPAGFALVSVAASATPGQQELLVEHFDGAFIKQPTATARLGNVTTAHVVARAQGTDVYVALLQGTAIELSKVTLEGAIVPLAAAPAFDTTAPFSLGVSSTLVVVSYRGAGGQARSLEWHLDGTPPVARRIDLFEDGGSPTSVSVVLGSPGGRYVAWRGDSAMGPVTQVRSTGTDLPLVTTAQSPGPAGAFLLEGPQGQVFSVYGQTTASSSGVYLVKNLLDGGAEYPVATAVNPASLSAVHGIVGTTGALMAWLDADQRGVQVASHLAIGDQAVISQRLVPVAGFPGKPRLASAGTTMLGLAWEQAGTISARRVCVP